MNEKKLPYYDFGKVLSYNAVYNFIVGGRGLGKTYGAKKHAINNFIREGKQFIYLRRFKTELGTRSTFFDDIAHEWPEFQFRVNGHQAEMRFSSDPESEEPWKIMGYFAALSNSQSRKSVAYPNVTTIIFDEFIIEKGALHYLPSEQEVFNNFYSTVDRWKDKTRVLFLANSVSIMNPYFMTYKIRPTREFVRAHKGFVLAHFAKSENFANAVRETRFGKFIAGTEYEDYSVGNVFKDGHDYLIERKSAYGEYLTTIKTRSSGAFSIWVERGTNTQPKFFAQRKRPKSERVVVLDPTMVSEDAVYLPYSDKLLQTIRTAYNRGRMYFDEPETRNSFAELYKR